ncbi:MAG: aspartate-semialdehyde dehydrogenase [Alphaproteobacteria bacterium]|nr:aspartate-semialdehyde dehydrogenase [Alphaproteobacteria bacterium]
MKFNVAVVGATGNVGSQMLKILAERNFPVGNVYALASSSSIGKEVSFGEEKIVKVDALENFDFHKTDITLFSVNSDLSEKYAPIATAANNIVIDNTPQFRMDKDVPLVVPEVNEEALNFFDNKNIVANPNCVAIPVAVALKPLHDLYKIKRVILSSYQSVSGVGKKGMDELYEQTKATYVYKKVDSSSFKKKIAFNLIPQIGEFGDNGFTSEESKVIEELQKMFAEDIEVVATCVRVPVFIGHSISVSVEFEKNIDLVDVKNALKSAPGVLVSDMKDPYHYATPIEVAGRDEVFVSRLRKNMKRNNELSMWIVSDNLRKGAALNAVQIAEVLVKKYL